MQPTEGFQGTKRFVVEGRLGAGGMGVVHRVRDTDRGATVALKTVTHLDPDALLRFKKEFRSLADISHPNVVQLYELFSDEDQWFFTMELVEGVDLLTWVKSSLSMPPPPLLVPGAAREGAEMLSTMALSSVGAILPLASGERAGPPSAPASGRKERFGVRDVGRLCEALRQLAEGLGAIHSAGKLHRDVKPPNVMVTRGGRVVLLDFGLAADFQSRPRRAPSEDPLAGTPAYMAPEQGAFQRATPASDWYAVGVILYEALAGRVPFDGSPAALLLHKQHASPEPPSSFVEGVPDHLEHLAMDLLRIDPRARPSGDEVLSRLARLSREGGPRTSVSVDVPFVGRRAELAGLRDAYEASATGPVVVLLHGPSGMGKTALASRFLGGLAADPRTLVVSGRCYERETVPFKAVDPVVDELADWLSHLRVPDAAELVPPDLAALARVFPVLGELARRPGRGAEPEGRELERIEPQELRKMAFAAMRALIATLAAARQLVIHIDDLQWCDPDSVELLEALLAAPSPPWLLVCAYRTEPPRPLVGPLAKLVSTLRGLGERCSVRDVEVGELLPADAKELATALTGEARVASRVTEEANNHPLFLTELARSARASSSMAPRASAQPTDQALSLDQVIHDRVAGLPPDARALLETLSVARGPLSHGIAAKAAALDEKAAGAGSGPQRDRSAALALRSARLVVTRGMGDDDPIETAHDRVRRSVSESLDEARRRACHAGIAHALAGSSSVDAQTVFAHFRAAGDVENATSWVMRAAESQDRALAFFGAAELYRAAIELRAAPLATLHRRLGDALANAGRLDEAADAYLAGAAHGGRAEALELRRMAAEDYLKSGHDARGIQALRGVLEEVDLPYPESSERAIASLLWHEAKIRVLPLSRRLRGATVPPPRSPANMARIDAAFAAATGLSINDPLRGADFASRGLFLALESGEPLRLSRALAVAAGNVASRGEPGRARAYELVRAAEEVAEQVDEPRARALALLISGMVSCQLGEWQSGRSSLERADAIFRDRCRAVAWERASAHAWTCNALILSGELREAASRVPALIEEALSRGDRFALAYLVYPASVLAIAAGDVAGAVKAAGLADGGDRTLFTANRWGAFISRASIARYRGDGGAAWQLAVSESRPLEGSMLWRAAMVRVFSYYERGLSALAAAAKGVERTVALRAADGWAKDLAHEKLRYAPALGHLLRAGAAAVRGEKGSAVDALGAAIPGLDAAGLGYLAACARHRHGELVGGSLGRELIERSRSFFGAQAIASHEPLLAMSAPGF